MNPFYLFLLAILSPLLLAITLLVPPYAGIVAASYIIYDKGAKLHPLHDKMLDVFYMIEVYSRLFSQWSKHMETTSLVSYTLPLILFPLMGIILALGLTSRLSRKLQNIFQIGSH